jgi:hypothetical protein
MNGNKLRCTLFPQVSPSLTAALLAPVSRARVVAQVQLVLGVSQKKTAEIVAAFDEFVAKPLEKRLKDMHGRDLAQRNPMIYTARGVETVAEWMAAVLTDQETARIENLLGTWQEEVAKIVSDGEKPAGGVDLQVRGGDGVVRLYAIQTAPNTKNASGRKNDIRALRDGASILHNQRQHVELFIATLHGRRASARHPSESGIEMLGSDDFWRSMSGIPDFRARIVQATTILAELISERSADDVDRIRAEAELLYDNGDGSLKMDALLHPPRRLKVARPEQLELDVS